MLSDDQRALLIDLSQHVLAELKFRGHMHVQRRANIVFSHGGESSFEAACALLQKLHLAEPVDETTGEPRSHRSQWSMHFLLASSAAAEGILSSKGPFPGILLDQALSVFLDLKVNYGAKPPLTATRSSFAAPLGYEPTFELLRACGYIDGPNSSVIWTSKCKSAMRRVYLWTDDGQSEREVEQNAIDEEARRILASMPGDVKRLVSGDTPDTISLTKEIALRWRDGRWRSAKSGPITLSGQVQLARRVIELYQSGRR